MRSARATPAAAPARAGGRSRREPAGDRARHDHPGVKPVLLTWLGLMATAAVVVWWSVGGASREPEPVAGTAEVRGGLLRIDAVGAEDATHLPMAMPGMTHDQIPEDHYLLRLDATLGATDGPIAYRPEDFRVRGPGIGAVEPYRAVAGPGTVFEGMTAPLLLVFEVPKGVGPLLLEYGGTQLALDSVTVAADHPDGH